MTKSVKLEDDIHKELGNLGKTSETYNDVIRRLIKHWKDTHK